MVLLLDGLRSGWLNPPAAAVVLIWHMMSSRGLTPILLSLALQLDEFAVIEMIEKLTDPSSERGEWLARLDLQEDGAKLKVVDMGQLSHCDSSSECKTLVRAAEEVLGDHDTDVAEALWKVGWQRWAVLEHDRLARSIMCSRGAE